MTVPIGTLLAALALLLVVSALIAQPLLGPRRPAVLPESERDRLERKRKRIVRAIREVDFDRGTGKLDAEDHSQLRTDLQAQGADALRALGALQTTPGARDIDAEIEASVAALREKPDSSRHCAKCGGLVKLEDQFCPRCGARLPA
ncbi:MAG: zinc ribbon domain-containing protein [Thermoflexales bacterium]